MALVGDFSAQYDEGLKNIAKHTARILQSDHQVKRVDLGTVFSRRFWSDLDSCNPDIVHYIPGNTVRGLVLAKIIGYQCQAPLVVSINHPGESRFLRGNPPNLVAGVFNVIEPDFAIIQSEPLKGLLDTTGWDYKIVGNGVDIEKYRPVSASRRSEFREKLGYNDDDRIVLHVGHVTEKRNLLPLIGLKNRGYEVLIISSRYQGVDKETKAKLERAGCDLRFGYRDNLEDFYCASDVYIFPVEPYNTLLMPLSVLEAMACNTRVVTTRHRGLTLFFEPGDGFTFTAPRNLESAVREVLDGPVSTRKKVMRFSWTRVRETLEDLYESVVDGEGGDLR